LDDRTFEQLRFLTRLAREHGLAEITVETAHGLIRLRRGRPGSKGRRPGAAVSRDRLHEIRAPLVGVFYRAPTPDAPPYVDVGDRVEPGQTVGLIEAMKVFSEIGSEIEGRVVAIPAGSGELVAAGQTLIVVEASG
jgi:acetyl-CoA carboxylase biotin carboxyl carrier protein